MKVTQAIKTALLLSVILQTTLGRPSSPPVKVRAKSEVFKKVFHQKDHILFELFENIQIGNYTLTDKQTL